MDRVDFHDSSPIYHSTTHDPNHSFRLGHNRTNSSYMIKFDENTRKGRIRENPRNMYAMSYHPISGKVADARNFPISGKQSRFFLQDSKNLTGN